MVLAYFTNLARSYPFEELRQGMMGPCLVRHEGVGVVAAIVPWNVPLFTIMLKPPMRSSRPASPRASSTWSPRTVR